MDNLPKRRPDADYGCSDHGCVFGHPGGMGTNGGCACLKDVRCVSDRVNLQKGIRDLRQQLSDALLKANMGNLAQEANERSELMRILSGEDDLGEDDGVPDLVDKMRVKLEEIVRKLSKANWKEKGHHCDYKKAVEGAHDALDRFTKTYLRRRA